MFSCEYCEIFKNSFFIENLVTTFLLFRRFPNQLKTRKTMTDYWADHYDFTSVKVCKSMLKFCKSLHFTKYHNGSTTLVIIFWQDTLFHYRFDPPQVKEDLAFGMIDFVQEFPQEMPNKGIRKSQENLKTVWRHSLVPSPPPRMNFWQWQSKITQKQIPSFPVFYNF